MYQEVSSRGKACGKGGEGGLISSPEGGLLIGFVIELKLPMIAVKL